jgi:hypothetical protein
MQGKSMNTNTASTPSTDTVRQHRKPICNSQGYCIGYTDWMDGDGLPWWPDRVLGTVVDTKYPSRKSATWRNRTGRTPGFKKTRP